MDLDDVLEDLLENATHRARDGARRAGEQLRRRSRVPAFRMRLRTATLWVSGAWLATFGGLGVASELALDGGAGTALAIVFGGMALPAVPTGVWAWRARRRDRALAREAAARRRARQERDQLPVDVVRDWSRLRQAQALVEDLADQGLVDVAAVTELDVMVTQTHGLLVADRRASELGAAPSVPLRQQLADVCDLLVALAAEAVELRTEEVDHGAVRATMLDAHERLRALRAAHAEVSGATVEGRLARANALVERERAERAAAAAGDAARQPTPPPPVARPAAAPDAGPGERPGEQRPMPG